LLGGFGLPLELTIYCYNDINVRFAQKLSPLATIWERDLKPGDETEQMPPDWNRFWHFADEEYVQGGGWFCLEDVTGRLYVIDLDLEPDPIYLLNSSVANFITTLAYFLDWSERTGGTPAATVLLRDELLRQNCIPPEELEPFWMNFIDATLDGDPINLTVSLDSTAK